MRFEKIFGRPPGYRPVLYWYPWLGDHCHVGPSDMGSLTISQLLSCFDYVKRDD